ncbi:hypothetical protein ABPG74_022777 [Tetrahymena malaccensis]
MKVNQLSQKKDLWEDWVLFKKTDFTNPALQLKKQGASFKNDQYGEFTYRPSYSSPPSMQEFCEAVINGAIKRYQMGLYKGEYQYYIELQNCLHEFIKLLNFKSEILVEVFQSITNINLSKEQCPNIVVPCASCHMYIYVNFHCNRCFSAFYCDKTCMKNHKSKHDQECGQLIKLTPTIIYPLQVEIHCGGDLGENVEIYYQHEQRITLKYCGQKFFSNLFKILLKNRWLKNNGYSVSENNEKNCIQLTYKKDEYGLNSKSQQNLEEEGEKQNQEQTNTNQQNVRQQNQQSEKNKENSSQTEEELFLKMPCIQEMRVIFLNQGAILQDIIKETYDLYTHYIHIYYFPI